MLLPFIDSFEKFIIFGLTLSLLVIVHEGGHFWVARLNGVAVTEFAVGFGPAIASIRSKRSGTRYRLNLIPLGGYCAMMGEDARRELPDDPIGVAGVDYSIRAPWQRFAIIAAGPLVNLVAAFCILLASIVFIGTPNDHSSTKVGKVIAGDPAERAGLRPGDEITAIDGKTVVDGASMVKTINASLGKTLTMTYLHHGTVMTTHITPIPMEQHGKKIGVTGFMPLTEYKHMPLQVAVVDAASEMGQMWDSTFEGLSDLVVHANTAGDELVGPVGMARAAVAIQDYGVGAYLWFAAFISLSLGIFNLLPIPALDGGRILFIFVELVRGRPIDPEKEAMVHMTGFAALIAFVLFRTYHDIINMVAGKSAI
jgi:regulator of sigma E protease